MQKWSAFIFVLLLACAHKAPPLSKDRLNPKLIRTTVLNARQLQLSFNEEIDTLALFPDSVHITSPKDTLTVMSLYPSLSASEIVVATSPMKKDGYEIVGSVFDKAENKGNFRSSFQGTTSPDTISPWVAGSAEGRNTREFFLNFSEAMDTTTLLFAIVPKKQLLPVWVNYRYVRFIPESGSESLCFDTTYYMYLKQASDISGNYIQAFITAITPDTVYRPIRLQGRALIDGSPAQSGLAILKREKPVGIAMLKKGAFTFEVRDSLAFDIQIITPDHSGKGTVMVGGDNIIHLEKGKIDIDRIID
jgi:hypothetical protein